MDINNIPLINTIWYFSWHFDCKSNLKVPSICLPFYLKTMPLDPHNEPSIKLKRYRKDPVQIELRAPSAMFSYLHESIVSLPPPPLPRPTLPQSPPNHHPSQNH